MKIYKILLVGASSSSHETVEASSFGFGAKGHAILFFDENDKIVAMYPTDRTVIYEIEETK